MSAKIFHLYLLLCSSVFENDVRVVKKQRLLCRLADASGGKRSRFVVSDSLTTRRLQKETSPTIRAKRVGCDATKTPFSKNDRQKNFRGLSSLKSS
jgi:hypothetical protein